MTLTHGCNTPWADAAQVEQGYFPPRSDGITQFGQKVGGSQAQCSRVVHSNWSDPSKYCALIGWFHNVADASSLMYAINKTQL